MTYEAQGSRMGGRVNDEVEEGLVVGDEVTNPFEVLEVQLQLQLLHITSFLA